MACLVFIGVLFVLAAQREGTWQERQQRGVKEITVLDFKAMKEAGEDFLLLDVREPWEYKIVNLGARNIPLGTLEEHVATLPKDRKIIVHCRSGKRSARAAKLLTEQYAFEEVYNLQGGLLKYAKEVDSSLPTY